MGWSTVKVEGASRVDRIAEVFEIWLADSAFPFAKFKIKVVERAGADYLGVPNLAKRNPATGDPEYTSGLGNTVEEALADTLRYFLREVDKNKPVTGPKEADSVWSAV